MLSAARRPLRTAARARLRIAVRAQGGFTLIELLIAMSCGIIIMLATFALIDLTVEMTQRVTDRVDSTARGREFMEQLVQELNSGCLLPDVSPVQAASASGISPAVSSDGSDLVFVSGLGDGQTATPVEHVVTFKSGTITDTSYANTGGSGATTTAASTWTFSSTPSTARQLTNVFSAGFTYYSYSNPSNNPTNSLSGPAALSTPLSSVWPATSGETNGAPAVARVDIAFQVGPTSGSTSTAARTTLNDSVVFRLTPASSSGVNLPCD